MPRAFDRGVPAVDKNPLLSATNWSDPQSIIGEAAVTAGDQIRNNLIDIIKGITGIDLATVPALLDSIGEELTLFVDWLTGLIDLQGLLDFLSWLWGGIEEGFSGFSATVETALKPIVEWLSWLWAEFGAQSETFLKPIFQFLEWLWAGVQDGFAGFGATADTLLKPLLVWLAWLWEEFGSASETFLKPVIEFLSWLWSGVTGGFAGFGGTVDSVLKPLLVWLNWVWTQFGSASETFLKPVFTWLSWLWTQFGASVETFLKPAFTWLKWLWDLFGASVETVLKPAFEFLNWLFGTLFTGALTALRELFTALKNAIATTGSMSSWIDQIPLIGPIVSRLTGYTEADGIALDFTTLGNWANGLLTKTGDVPAANLKGFLNPALLSSIPIANINIDSPNLLSQGDFGNASTIDAANGWEWDSAVTHSGSGGSVKVTANGTLRELFSNQVIKVTAGDRINLAAYIKTSGFSGSSTSIQVSLVPFVGTARYTVSGSPVTITFNSRGAATDWAQATGSASANPVTAPWTVPATVTSVRVRLAITSAATSGTVWFDDIDVHKTGLLGQNLVEYLLNAWENMWTGLVGTSGSGKTWADMFNAGYFLRSFANGTDLNLTTLGGNLLDAPAEVLGSLFSVVFDGTKTVGDFLKLLYNALNGSSSTTTKNATDVATAAGAARDIAVLASGNADTASGAASIADGKAVTADGKAVTADTIATFASAANNMILSPDFEESTIRRSTGGAGGSGVLTWAYSTAQYITGSQSIKLTTTTAALTGGAYRFINLTPVLADGTRIRYPIAVGQVYKYDAEYYVTGTSTTITIGPGFQMFNAAGQSSGIYTENMFSSIVNPTKNAWQRVTGTFTIPATVNSTVGEPLFAYPIFTVANTNVNDVVYIDRIIIYR